LGRWAGTKKDVDIAVQDGVVTLKGKTTVELAGELVGLIESVPGVVSVEDELTVPQRS
jgi:osmotically-inducible protein OsmY